VIRIVRQSCYSQDLQIMATYLVDKGSDLSWSCVVNGDTYGGSTDSCLEKSGYFVRSCEDTLVQRQRDAREGRSSTDIQRRICCALFFYRDCISRVVVDRCRDPSPTAVDILMGSRKRDLTTTCREYSRDQCSHSYTTKSSLITVLLSIVIAFKALKSNIF
ncbi:unnamed protein product, partial [Oppiella nova]